MPTVASRKVLVTGANGFVAVWVTHRLLEHGYSVRASVHSEGKAAHLRKIFASYDDKLEFSVVPDITATRVFDEAVKGVDAVEHTASPFHYQADDPDEMIVPAVQGTTRVLESVLARGTSVKRVVITSSCVSIMKFGGVPQLYSEDDWNDQAVDEVKEKGRDADQPFKYGASKTLAERAAWEFMEKHKGKTLFDLVVLNPPYVLGPVLQEVASPNALNESMDQLYNAVFKGIFPLGKLSGFGHEWIDVRDLGEAHVLAIQKEAAGGERIIVSNGLWKWQDWINAARKAGATDAIVGDAAYDPTKAVHIWRFDASKAQKLLGLKYHSMYETTRDILSDFRPRGWVKA